MIHSVRSRTGTPRLVAGAVLALSIAALAAAGCNFIDVVRGRHARISNLVPGGNTANNQLDCWVTLKHVYSTTPGGFF
jgi:hypothetical protein